MVSGVPGDPFTRFGTISDRRMIGFRATADRSLVTHASGIWATRVSMPNLRLYEVRRRAQVKRWVDR
jgi:hypothetical protein